MSRLLRFVSVALCLVLLPACGRTQPDSLAESDPATLDSGPLERTDEQRLGTGFLEPSPRFSDPPELSLIELPPIAGGNAIWGATGRDDLGNVYLGVSCHGEARLSAALCRVDANSNKAQSLGDVVSQLENVVADGIPQQAKIHGKPVLANDGYLYFTSQDEEGEKEDGSALPTWGSHLWRIDPTEDPTYWEHVRAFPEALIATACTGRFVYALGYFGHVIYQFDTETRSIRRKTVGSPGGHISRNFLVDLHEHAYVPRVRQTGTRTFDVELVELDHELNEVVAHPLSDYGATIDFQSHGLVGFAALRTGAWLFVTAKGALYKLTPVENAPSQLDRLGWIHPAGESYSAFLVCPDGKTTLCALARRPKSEWAWITYDLSTGVATTVSLPSTAQSMLRRQQALYYGSNTLDEQGNAFLVGQYAIEKSEAVPIAIRVSWPD